MELEVIEKLSIDERIELIGELWDSIDKEKLEIPSGIQLEVKKRHEDIISGKSKLKSWNEFKNYIDKRS